MILDPTIKLYLIRHGETQWNVAGRRQGHGDSPLTAVGRRQAETVGLSLFRYGVIDNKVEIISSPSGRATATTEIICNAAHIPLNRISTDSRLMEAGHGVWEGLTKAEIELEYPGQIEERVRNHWSYKVPGGESYQDISIRIDDWLNTLESGRTVVAITHDMVSRVVRKQYLGLPIEQALTLKHNQSEYYILEGGRCTRHRA